MEPGVVYGLISGAVLIVVMGAKIALDFLGFVDHQRVQPAREVVFYGEVTGRNLFIDVARSERQDELPPYYESADDYGSFGSLSP